MRLIMFIMVSMFAVGTSGAMAEDPARAAAGPTSTVIIWPDAPPGKAATGPERLEPPAGDNVQRLTNVGRPTMTVYPVAGAARPTPAVLVFPGGGYRILSMDKEGAEIAAWLNSIGVAAAVLKYRVPNNRDGAFQDAQRALGLLRDGAKTWNVDPGRVGVIGFSAGGHLAARLSTNYQKRAYAAVDAADKLPCRPDFTVLVYPAYLSKQGQPCELVDEMTVTKKTPTTFLIQSQDDRKYIDSSVAYYLALKRVGVRAELHLFPGGGHGYGMRGDARSATEWPKLCEAWLQENRVVTPRKTPGP